MSSEIWDLEVLIDQFTLIPRAREEAIIPDMRWQNSMTVFSEPIEMGELIVRPLSTHGPLTRNFMIVGKKIDAQNYLSATQTVFWETQRILDLLSIVTSRGFRIVRVRPAENVLRKLGLIPSRNLRDRIRRFLMRNLSEKPAVVEISRGGKSTSILTAYKEYLVVSSDENYLEEDAVFTTDFPGLGAAEVKIEMLRKDEFDRRLKIVETNLPRLLATKELVSAIRLYRVSLQMNEYMVRYALEWTALESATQVPDGVIGEAKIGWICSKIINVPGITDLRTLKDLLRKLNRTRNKIQHDSAFALRPEFQRELPQSLVSLEWLLYNYLSSQLGLPMLPETSSPLCL